MKFDIARITAPVSTGAQSYSHGLGETPKLALFLAPHELYDDFFENTFTVFGAIMFGAADGVRNRCGTGVAQDDGSVHITRRAIHTDACVVGYNLNDLTLKFKAALSSWNSATFSLNWTTTAGSSGQTFPIYVILFSGDDFNARVDHGSMRISAGTQDYTGVADGKALITWCGGAITSVNSLIAGMGLSLGFVDEAGNARARSCFATDTTNDVAYYSDTAAALLANGSTGAISAKAAFVSHNPAGAASFGLNFTTPASAAWQFIYIHLGGSGLKANAGHFTTQPNNTVDTPGNKPRVVLYSGNGVSTLNAGTVGDIMFSIGAGGNEVGDEYGVSVNADNANGVCSGIATVNRALTHALSGGTDETNGIVQLSNAPTAEDFKTAKAGSGGNFVPFYLALGVSSFVIGETLYDVPPGVIAIHNFSQPDGTLLENAPTNPIALNFSWLKRDQMGAVDIALVEGGAGLFVSPGANTTYDGYSCSLEPDNDEYWAMCECKHLNNNSSGNWLVLHVRSSPDGSKRTFYRLQLRMTDGAFLIRRFVDGAEVGIASGNVGDQVPADTLVRLKFYTRVDQNGDVVLRGFFNNELILDAVDSDVNRITNRGLAGIGAICGAGAQLVTWSSFKLYTPE